jgi:hypothetical protein
MGLGTFGASAPLFLRNGELLGHSPIQTGWLGIGIMCPSGATDISAHCCFSELAL